MKNIQGRMLFCTVTQKDFVMKLVTVELIVDIWIVKKQFSARIKDTVEEDENMTK